MTAMSPSSTIGSRTARRDTRLAGVRSPLLASDAPHHGLARFARRYCLTLAMSTDPRFARPTPFARLMYAHAVTVCGDACLTVSLAGSLFFQSPTHAARGHVFLYLLLT